MPENTPRSLLAAVAPCLNPTSDLAEWGGRALAPEPLNLAPTSIAEQGGGVWCAAWLVSRRRSLLRVAPDPKPTAIAEWGGGALVSANPNRANAPELLEQGGWG